MELMSVHIPGKVMLSGEYAVLYGAKAVLLPVKKYLVVSEVLETKNEISSPVIHEALAEEIEEIKDFEILNGKPLLFIDRSQFLIENPDGSKNKLGLGSSAAEAVGIIALRYKRAGIDWTKIRGRVAEKAEAAHKRAQGGKGSGADVYLSAMEEAILFSRHDSDISWELIDAVKPTAPLALMWSGTSANTRDFVSKFDKWLSSDPKAICLRDELVESSNKLADFWFDSNVNDLFKQLDIFVKKMKLIASSASMPWQLPIHNEVEKWARSHGGRAKPTGAGGGDLILLIGDLPYEERDELIFRL